MVPYRGVDNEIFHTVLLVLLSLNRLFSGCSQKGLLQLHTYILGLFNDSTQH